MAKFYAKAPDGSAALISIVLTGFTQSLQQNGWCKLPNGLLFQWSNDTLGPIISSNPNTNYWVEQWYFPVTFNNLLSVLIGYIIDSLCNLGIEHTLSYLLMKNDLSKPEFRLCCQHGGLVIGY